MTIDKKKWEIRQGDPTKPGVTKVPTGYNFSICVEETGSVELLFYRREEEEPEQVIQLSEDYRTGHVYAVTVLKNNLLSYEYEYRLNGTVIQDSCARLCMGNAVFGEKKEEKRYRYGVLKELPVEYKREKIPYEDMILYKVHVRGYTMHKNSRVRKKGTFQGLSEKIGYWKDLGITSIELMPAYDFLEYPEKETADRYSLLEYKEARLNYWGYTKGNYFAPKAAYCAGNSPEQEVKNFISKLHKEGMECLMDFYFPREIEPQLVQEVLRFWKLEYHMDGFVLFGEGVWNDLISRDPILADTKLICPGWNVEQKPKGKKQVKPVRRLAEYNIGFQDTMRRFLKGDEEQLPGVLYYAKRNPSDYGVVNYMANHDGFTLADLVTYDYRHNEENGEDNRDGSSYNYSYNCGIEGPTRKQAVLEIRGKQMRNAVLLLMLSQGTPLIYGGDEMGNTQKGNNNAYCQDNEIGWVDWSSAKRFSGFTSFVREVIRFRKSHPILHMPYELRATDYKSLGWPELSYHSEKAWFSNTEGCSRHSGILYCGGYARKENGDPDDFIYVMYNMHWHECAFAIPDLPEGMKWYLAIDSCKKAEEAVAVPGEEKVVREKKSLMVPARSIMVFVGK